jgi:hypothetical protein
MKNGRQLSDLQNEAGAKQNGPAILPAGPLL